MVEKFKTLILFFLIVIAILIGFSSEASANIKFVGKCGNLSYKLDVPTNKFFGGQCVNDRVMVYNDKNTDEIQAIYADPLISSSFDVYDPQNYKVLKSFDSTVNNGYILFSSDLHTSFLYGLSGVLCGFMFVQLIVGSIIRV